MSREWREPRVSISSHVVPLGHPVCVDPLHFHLIAPFTKDARQWSKLRWTDVSSGEAFGITTHATMADARTARVQSYGDVITRYWAHPEAKSMGPDRLPYGRQTIGLLQRLPVTLGEVVYVGKETNRLDEVEAGAIHDWQEVQLVFRRPDSSSPPSKVAALAGETGGRRCQQCGTRLTKPRRKFCSAACRQRAYRQRQVRSP